MTHDTFDTIVDECVFCRTIPCTCEPFGEDEEEEGPAHHCIISTCINYSPGCGTQCPECKMAYRAFVATQASDLLTFEQYVEYYQADLKEHTNFLNTMANQ